MEVKQINELQVLALRKMLGFGSVILDLKNVDYTKGRGEEATDHGINYFLWTKDGRRITVSHFLSENGPSTIGSISSISDPNIPPSRFIETPVLRLFRCVNPDCDELVDLRKRKSGACCRAHMNYICDHPKCVEKARKQNWNAYTHPYGTKIGMEHLQYKRD